MWRSPRLNFSSAIFLYINNLVNAFSLANVIMFADDMNLFCSNTNNLDNLVEKTNIGLELISKWFKLNKLSLNVKKTNFIFFVISIGN